MSYFNVLICMAGNTSKTRDDMQVEKCRVHVEEHIMQFHQECHQKLTYSKK